MNVFAKIFSQIFDSSISADYMVRHIFMDLLVLADRDGVVDMTTDAISRRTNIPEHIVIDAIRELCKPDIKSRSHEEDGCRLVAVDSHRDWGWQIVNYEHYRNIKDEEARRTYFRDKKREQRSKNPPHSTSGQTLSNSVKDSPIKSNKVTQGEEEGEEEVSKEKPSRAKKAQVTNGPGKDGTFTCPLWIPETVWKDFEEMRRKIRAPLTDRARKNLVGELQRFREQGQDVEAILNQSITKAWRGIFPVNGGNGAAPPTAHETDYDRKVKGIMAERAALRG